MQTLKIEIDIEDISPKEASELCEYITDYIVKNYNVNDYSYSVEDGE